MLQCHVIDAAHFQTRTDAGEWGQRPYLSDIGARHPGRYKLELREYGQLVRREQIPRHAGAAIERPVKGGCQNSWLEIMLSPINRVIQVTEQFCGGVIACSPLWGTGCPDKIQFDIPFRLGIERHQKITK